MANDKITVYKYKDRCTFRQQVKMYIKTHFHSVVMCRINVDINACKECFLYTR
jgi:hypothetical protein